MFQVELKVMDALTAPFEPASFDVVYSRDTILHIQNKEELFKLCLVSSKLFLLSFICECVFINSLNTDACTLVCAYFFDIICK